MTDLDPKESIQAFYARALARERTRAGMTQDQLGAHPAVIVSGKLIGHVENCRRPPTERLSKGIDTALNLEEYFESLYDHMVKEDGQPSDFWEYLEVEPHADSVKSYDSQWIPGLLQTEETARVILSAENQGDKLERLIANRMERQEILHREEPPWLVVAIDEHVIRRTVGSREITRRQLDHLYALSQNPNINIVIVPDGAQVYPTGSFILLGFAKGPDLAYLECAGDNKRILDNDRKVKELSIIFDRITTAAMTVADSRELIRKVREGM
ncbi:hypothetical protein J4573_52165 [Actinomadura barringtoniae]|uniref:DUF5753 domain-containing protein n=1 Tax=Actinomadura barringtoniae TaxID=1427535 RepID=A0A939PPE6_9ACTN|nr:DUF5753 domain-containing protein [Actinomadura barringtoniae]MBO2455713.1 hypothetical protein [Actinomadura barringtoniae]